MKKLIGFYVFLIFLLLGFYVFLLFQTNEEINNNENPDTSSVADIEIQNINSTNTEIVENNTTEEAGINDALKYDVIKLSPAQQSLASSLGYSITSIELTPAVLSCIVDKVGEKRTEEMIQGASPGPLEIVKLSKCLP